MKHSKLEDILLKYTKGEITLAETNAELEAAGSDIRLVPGQNELTEADIEETVTGDDPTDAEGWGLLDTGTGTMEKVRVDCGELDEAINQIQPDGTTNMLAYVLIGGKRYEVLGDTLTDC